MILSFILGVVLGGLLGAAVAFVILVGAIQQGIGKGLNL